MICKYAATPLNIPNCRYLLDRVEEIDIVEPMLWVSEDEEWPIKLSPKYDGGYYCSSSFDFPGGLVNEKIKRFENYVERLEMWCKMVLERGADLSLLSDAGDLDGNTISLGAVNIQSAVGYCHSFIDHVH